jgi:hypothetical protein
MGAKKKTYVWSIPQGYVGIKYTPYCLKISLYGEVLYFDRNIGLSVTEEQIKQSIPNLKESEQRALLKFFDRHPSYEDKVLFWTRGIQRTGRVVLKRYARELEQEILSQKFKKENTNNSIQKVGERKVECI